VLRGTAGPKSGRFHFCGKGSFLRAEICGRAEVRPLSFI
jgi:hypothetical protein